MTDGAVKGHNPQNPMTVQGDGVVLLEVDNPLFEDARDALTVIAELEKSPEYIHTYKITSFSLWNAAALGFEPDDILHNLRRFSKHPIPQNIERWVKDCVSRYGSVKLRSDGEGLLLYTRDEGILSMVKRDPAVSHYILGDWGGDGLTVSVRPEMRGHLKKALMDLGYPAEDLAGYKDGEMLPINLRSTTLTGAPFQLRRYQVEAVDAFYAGGTVFGGSGTIVLPCGAGKTMVGLGIMEKLCTSTLILCPNNIGVKQWIREITDKTDVGPDTIGEYTGTVKDIKPITVTTYQIITHRRSLDSDFPHFDIFRKRGWGLIIYDEVHLLPAPVFRITSELQAVRRLGLTATLVREDRKEGDVFSLIGPKKYDVPWRVLEGQGWIAEARCIEVVVPLEGEARMAYSLAHPRGRYNAAATNPAKDRVVRELQRIHENDKILVMGMYLDQLQRIAKEHGAPLITGQTSRRKREALYTKFRKGEIGLLVVSKVANFALDLPNANIAIQVSGTFGSRQEEAQRLGRILRPKVGGGKAIFYSLVSGDSVDRDFSFRRQIFLIEQGYSYLVVDADEMGEKVIGDATSDDGYSEEDAR